MNIRVGHNCRNHHVCLDLWLIAASFDLHRLTRQADWLQLRGFIIVTLFAPTWYLTADWYHRANAGSPAHAEHSFARQLTLGGVPQFFEVTPKLYRGGQPTAEGFDSLARMGIGIVVDVRGSRKHERDVVTKLGMEYVPMPWHCPFPKDKIFARFLTLLPKRYVMSGDLPNDTTRIQRVLDQAVVTDR